MTGASVRSIGLVHPHSWPSIRRGGERYLHDLARYLATEDIAVDVLTYGRPEADHLQGARLRHLPVRGMLLAERFGLDATRSVGVAAAPFLRGHDYDVVHSFVPWGALAARAVGRRAVYSELGHPDGAWARRHRVRAVELRTASRAATKLAALSSSAASSLEGIVGRCPAVVPPGVWTSDFVVEPEPRRGAPVVLFNSAPHEWAKRLHYVIRAFPLVLAEHPDAVLCIGAGGEAAAATAFEAAGAAADIVRPATEFLGQGTLAELADRYRRATVTVLPSEWEAFGLVAVESLACGTPVVATEAGGMVDIADGADGLVHTFPVSGIQALAVAMLKAIEAAQTPGVPERCAAHARRWDWPTAIGPLHLRLYAEAMA